MFFMGLPHGMQIAPSLTMTLAANGWLLVLIYCLYCREETRKRLLQKFREHGALDSQHAMVVYETSHAGGALVRRLVGRGILRRTAAERYYLDEAAFLSLRRGEMRRAWLVAGVILLGVTMFAWFTSVHP